VFGLVAAAAALFPVVAKAGKNLNHNETLVRDHHD
jgi:hypothetical protein